jgi:hypothetical protein
MKNLCPCLLHDFKGFRVDEDPSKTHKTVVEFAKRGDFDGVDVGWVEQLVPQTERSFLLQISFTTRRNTKRRRQRKKQQRLRLCISL